MLIINVSPVRSDEPQPEVFYAAPVLTVNDIDYDLSELPDGATAEHPILGTVNRSGDNYEVTLQVSHGAHAPEETRFPAPIDVTEDGAVKLPLYDEVQPESEVADELA